MRLSRTFVGSNDLSVSAAEVTVNQDQFSSGQLCCLPEDLGTHHAILQIMPAWQTQKTGSGESYPKLCSSCPVKDTSSKDTRGTTPLKDSREISL